VSPCRGALDGASEGADEVDAALAAVIAPPARRGSNLSTFTAQHKLFLSVIDRRYSSYPTKRAYVELIKPTSVSPCPHDGTASHCGWLALTPHSRGVHSSTPQLNVSAF
jgi:hypothetical protein